MEVVKSHLPKSAVAPHSAQTVVMKGSETSHHKCYSHGSHDAM